MARNYLAKYNLLYVPDVRVVTEPKDIIEVFPQQLGLTLDEKKRELIRETACSFNDDVAQLCNTYLDYERIGRDNGMVLQPYKFWALSKEEHTQLNNIISTSDVALSSFTQLGTLPEWVLKRCLLLDCDLLNNLIA